MAIQTDARDVDVIDDKLNEIGSLADRLNQAGDVASARIREVEDRLSEFGLGVSAGTPTFWREPNTSETGEETFLDYRLAYGRLEGRFRIYVNCYEARPLDSGKVVDSGSPIWSRPYSNCKRGIRIEALSAVPWLLDAIYQKAAEFLDDAVSDEDARRLI